MSRPLDLLGPRSQTRHCVLALTAVAVLASGCAGQAPNEELGAPNESATPCGQAESLTFAVSSATPTLDPATINQAFSTFLQPAYEPLIRLDPSGDLVPALATEWGYVGEGNTRFELTLREGVVFPDGSALSAEGVKAHFEYLQGVPSPNAALLDGMTFEITGPLTLAIALENPNPILDQLLTQDWVIGMVISPEALAHPEQLGTTTAGAGRYVLDVDATVAGDTYVYTANPDYYDTEQIHFEEITLKVIANPNSVLSALRTGEVDAAMGDYTTAQAARGAGLQVVAQPTVWQGLGLFDREGTVAEPLSDVRVRQAINYAIDREAITEALYAGDGVAASQVALPGSDDFAEDTADLYDYDPERAEELLAEAGYAEGFTLPVASTGFANIGTAGQAIAAQLEQVGIELQLQEEDVTAYLESVFSGTVPAAVVGLGSPPIHTSATVALLPSGPFNPFRTEDEELLALYAAAAAASAEERGDLNRQIVARVQEQAWFAPVTYTPVYVYGSDVLGGLIVDEDYRILDPVQIFSTEC